MYLWCVRSTGPHLTWYLTYKRNTSSVTRAGTVDTVMRCDDTEGSSGGKPARPVLDSGPCVPVARTPLGGVEITCRLKRAQIKRRSRQSAKINTRYNLDCIAVGNSGFKHLATGLDDFRQTDGPHQEGEIQKEDKKRCFFNYSCRGTFLTDPRQEDGLRSSQHKHLPANTACVPTTFGRGRVGGNAAGHSTQRTNI